MVYKKVMKKLSTHNQLFLTPLGRYIWGICFFAFVMHQLLQKYGWLQIPWIDAWLDPFLLPVIVMPLLRWERQYATGAAGYRMSIMETIAMVMALMLASEVLLPWLSPRFIYDPVDLVCIAVGGLMYYLFMQ